MAKKKNLTEYQQARRQFVQMRTSAKGGEVTAEQKQKFRQRFDVLASDVQGRGKLARKLQPEASQEERKNFRRMLATEMPARRNLGGGTGGGTGGGSTSSSMPPVTSYTSEQITAMRKAAATMGPQLSMIRSATTTPVTSTPTATGKQNKQNRVVGALRGALINTIPGLGMVDQSRKEFDKGNVVGGVGRLLGGTAMVAATFLSGGKAPKGALGRGPIIKPTAPGPRTGGPVRPTAPSRGPLALGPGPKAPTPKVATPKAATPKAATPKAATPKATTPKATTPKAAPKPKAPAKTASPKGATPKEGPKTTPPAKTMPKKADTPTPTPKTMPKKADTPKPTPKTMPKTSPKGKGAKAEDAAYTLNQARIKYPKAQEADLAFIQKLNEAQQIVQKQGQNWQQYTRWLEGPATQAKIRQLRGK